MFTDDKRQPYNRLPAWYLTSQLTNFLELGAKFLKTARHLRLKIERLVARYLYIYPLQHNHLRIRIQEHYCNSDTLCSHHKEDHKRVSL